RLRHDGGEDDPQSGTVAGQFEKNPDRHRKGGASWKDRQRRKERQGSVAPSAGTLAAVLGKIKTGIRPDRIEAYETRPGQPCQPPGNPGHGKSFYRGMSR